MAPLTRDDPSMDDVAKLEQMIDELRRQREHCQPKTPANTRYHRYSMAVSALRWLVVDLQRRDREPLELRQGF